MKNELFRLDQICTLNFERDTKDCKTELRRSVIWNGSCLWKLPNTNDLRNSSLKLVCLRIKWKRTLLHKPMNEQHRSNNMMHKKDSNIHDTETFNTTSFLKCNYPWSPQFLNRNYLRNNCFIYLISLNLYNYCEFSILSGKIYFIKYASLFDMTTRFHALFFRKVLRAYQDSWNHRCRLLFCCMGNSDRNRVSFSCHSTHFRFLNNRSTVSLRKRNASFHTRLRKKSRT